MKYDVVFQSGLNGSGVIHLNDLGILCEGSAAQGGGMGVGSFTLGIAHGLMLIRTTRTIPYSTILKSKSKRLVSKSHTIEYRLPSGKTAKITFTMGKSKDESSPSFEDQLEQLRNSTRLLSGT